MNILWRSLKAKTAVLQIKILLVCICSPFVVDCQHKKNYQCTFLDVADFNVFNFQ